MENQKNQIINTATAKVSVRIQIAHQEITTKPQYADTQIRLMEVLIRGYAPQISMGNRKLYLFNWTKGPKIGRHLNPKQTLKDMLEGSEESIPKIRVQWSNPVSFTVCVDVHDTLQFTYSKMNMFYYVQDLLDSIKNDLIKELSLNADTIIKFNTGGALQNASRMKFVGHYLNVDRGAINNIKVYLKFYENISKQFVQTESSIDLDKLYCPISHMLMQQPITTQCHHTFDKLWISINICRQGKCPICRKSLLNTVLKKNKEVSDEIFKLKQKWREFKKTEKEEYN